MLIKQLHIWGAVFDMLTKCLVSGQLATYVSISDLRALLRRCSHNHDLPVTVLLVKRTGAYLRLAGL